jgi:hypothetical protein
MPWPGPGDRAPLRALAVRHTLNGVAWQTWGDNPYVALAAQFTSGPQSPGDRRKG